MKIVFDNIIFALQHCGGISVVWSNLLRHIVPQGDDVTVIEYDRGKDNINRQRLDLDHVDIRTKSSGGLRLRRFLDLTSADTGIQNESFIFHSSYYRLCRDPKAVCITTVHDFGYYLYVRNPLLRYIHCRQQFHAIRQADYVACISESTRRDLLRILPDVPAEKVRVIYNGVAELFRPIEGIAREDFALFVGKRDRYKNFDALLEPLGRIGKRLVIVGPKLTPTEQDNLHRYRVHYEYYGFATDEELNILYNKADCLIYPSLFEGFGLPVLEAQQAGCPVIAMNTSSIPEVIGDPSLLLDEISEKTLRPLLARMADPEQRKAIVENGMKNAARFSWEKMANQYYELYKEALQQNNQ